MPSATNSRYRRWHLDGRREREKARLEIEPGTIVKPRSCSVAGPCVVFRSLDHGGAHRIEVDVTRAGEQVGVGLNWAAFESAFP